MKEITGSTMTVSTQDQLVAMTTAALDGDKRRWRLCSKESNRIFLTEREYTFAIATYLWGELYYLMPLK